MADISHLPDSGADVARLQAQRAARRAAAQLLVELADGGAPSEVVDAYATNGEVEIRVVVARCPARDMPAEQQKPTGPVRLTPIDRRILAAATTDEKTMKALANRADHDNDTYFRARVAKLVTTGRLVSEFGGYRLA